MLKESRPHLEKTLVNFEAASGKLSPTIDNVNVTIGKANKLTDHLDSVVVENREEIHNTLLRLQTSLTEAERMINDLDDTLGANRGNLDETLENIRATSENLKEFSDTVKQHPYSLIRIKAEQDRLPPGGK
jgi:ABC-type transporter Mla subunit MlaD